MNWPDSKISFSDCSSVNIFVYILSLALQREDCWTASVQEMAAHGNKRNVVILTTVPNAVKPIEIAHEVRINWLLLIVSIKIWFRQDNYVKNCFHCTMTWIKELGLLMPAKKVILLEQSSTYGTKGVLRGESIEKFSLLPVSRGIKGNHASSCKHKFKLFWFHTYNCIFLIICVVSWLYLSQHFSTSQRDSLCTFWLYWKELLGYILQCNTVQLCDSFSFSIVHFTCWNFGNPITAISNMETTIPHTFFPKEEMIWRCSDSITLWQCARA